MLPKYAASTLLYSHLALSFQRRRNRLFPHLFGTTWLTSFRYTFNSCCSAGFGRGEAPLRIPGARIRSGRWYRLASPWLSVHALGKSIWRSAHSTIRTCSKLVRRLNGKVFTQHHRFMPERHLGRRQWEPSPVYLPLLLVGIVTRLQTENCVQGCSGGW